MHRLVRWPGTATVFVMGALLAGCPHSASNNSDGGPDGADARVNDAGARCDAGGCNDVETPPDDVQTQPDDADTTDLDASTDDAETPPDDAASTDLDASIDDTATPPDDTGTPPDDTATPPDDTGTPPDDTGGGTGNGPTVVLPDFDSATDQHVRDLVARGQAAGNSHDVFAKIGDSITESASFLWDCGFGWGVLGDHPEVGPTIAYFQTHIVDDNGRNSMNHASICAVAGWTSGDALNGDPSSLVQELDLTRPQWAIIMYGTNDIDRSDLPTYTANMNTILDTLEARAIVPVLSTIPPRLDGEPATSMVPTFNETIRGLAHARHIPLLDFWLALQPLPGYGISSDGIHPNTYDTGHACDFTADGLQYGYNVRTLTALQMFERLRSTY